MGAFARLPIKAGDLLIREAPALTGRLGQPPDRKQFRSLPESRRRSVMELCDGYAGGPGDESLEGIVATNALPRGVRSEETVLCPLASRFNHSCAPNAEYLWVEALFAEEVRAVRDIPVGEEICVNYFGDSIRHPTEVRRAHLRDGFRFDCRCRICVSADPASDRRRERLVKLGDEILSCHDKPEEGLRIAEDMLELMNTEQISAPRTVAQVCNDGFELALLLGDSSEVQYWAHLSYEAHRLGWGEDFPLTRRMKHYAQRPPDLTGGSSSGGARVSAPTVRRKPAVVGSDCINSGAGKSAGGGTGDNISAAQGSIGDVEAKAKVAPAAVPVAKAAAADSGDGGSSGEGLQAMTSWLGALD
mmetsp:Transcript_104499/g.262987  ORF Transcript_104499/g.262987 Transcript_104499/m.262987 type:complete len:360 (+) Transcript_104499:2-1081(+)